MTMTILLLGGNGLLGHNVLKRLLEQGHAVHALVRKSSALLVDGFANKELLTVFEGSLLNDMALHTAAKGCDTIVNCAGVTDMSLLKYEDYLPVNRDLCARLVGLMEREGINTLVHTSTANTIGYGAPGMMADETWEMRKPFADSYYARSKREGELILQSAAAQHPQWHIVIVNPGFMIGAYDTKPSSGTLLLSGYRKPLMLAPKGGKSFVHVESAAVAIVNAITHGISGQRYLLTGANMSLKSFYQLQSSTLGYRQLLLLVPNWLLGFVGRVGDVLRLCGLQTQVSTRNVRQLMVMEYYRNGRAQAELMMPSIPIDQAIGDFFSWYKKQ